MKHLLSLFCLLAILGAGAIGAQAQQTPANTVCNESSGLQWTSNLEGDMDHYNLYIANNPDIKNADPPVAAITVPHPTGKVDPVVYQMNSTMSEGPKYFAVTAADKTGNVSDYSVEIGCELNYRPNAPTLQFIFTKPTPSG